MAPPRRLRVVMYVQHLLGGGHLVRMRTLAAELARGGHGVVLISGGVGGGGGDGDAGIDGDGNDDGATNDNPATHTNPHTYHFHQLPAVKTAPGDFTTLLTATGRVVDDPFKAHRAEQLRRVVGREAFDVLLVETFPFGRGALRFELQPLLRQVTAMRPRPLVVCSLRDILQRRNPAHHRRSLTAVNAWFDYVLVHADPTIAKLDKTFPPTAELGAKVVYTGYLHATTNNAATIDPPPPPTPTPEIIISAGAGAVGLRLLQTALAARRHSRFSDRHWRLLAGANLPADAFAALANAAPASVTVERNRRDFPALLARCAVSVSQAGYNTVLDIVAANCPAVLVAYAGHGETEQTDRAALFAALGRAVTLAEADLTAPALAAAIDRAATLTPSACPPIQRDGATQTRRFLERTHAP